LYKNLLIAESKLSKKNKILQKEKEIEKILNNREYSFVLTKSKARKPSEEHPWHSFRLKGTKHFKRLKVNI